MSVAFFSIALWQSKKDTKWRLKRDGLEGHVENMERIRLKSVRGG